MIRIVCIFFFLTSNSVAFAQETTPATTSVLKLKAALEIALNNNPTLKSTREKENQVETELPIKRSALLPSLVGTLSGSRAKDAVNVGVPRFGGTPFNNYGSSLKLNQLLFQIGAKSALDAAKKDIQISKLDTQIAKRDLASNFIQAYFLVVLDSRNVDILLAQQKIAQEALAVAQRRQRTGQGSSLDVLQAKTQVALLEGELESARNLLQEATASLASLMGDTSSEQLSLENKMEAPEIAVVDKTVNLTDYKIPEITRSEIHVEKIDYEKRILWGQNLPSLNLVGNYNFANYVQADLFSDNGVSWNIGLQLTIPLFSGFSTIYQQRALDSEKAQYFFDKIALLNQISYQQVTSRKKLETAQSSIKTGKEALKIALASVNEARRNFNLANIDFTQFLSIQQSHAQAEQALNQYKYNYIVALTNYFTASGQDVEKLAELIEQANL